jgi:hypothetical protein
MNSESKKEGLPIIVKDCGAKVRQINDFKSPKATKKTVPKKGRYNSVTYSEKKPKLNPIIKLTKLSTDIPEDNFKAVTHKSIDRNAEKMLIQQKRARFDHVIAEQV